MAAAKAWQLWAGMVSSPRTALRELSRTRALGTAALGVSAAGALWALLSYLLWRAGHAPSRTPVAAWRESYYLMQAVVVVPTLLTCWAVLGAVAQVLAKKLGGSGSLRTMLTCLAPSFAIPLVLAFVVPDLIVFLSFGFDALGKLVRFSGLVLVVWELALASLAVETVHGLSRGRAALVAFVALLAQALLGASVLR